MPEQQAKRSVGRPPIEGKEPMQDIHLRIPVKLVEAIDGSRGKKSRTELIREAIELHGDISLWIRYYGKKQANG